MEKKEKQHFFPFIPHKGKKYGSSEILCDDLIVG